MPTVLNQSQASTGSTSGKSRRTVPLFFRYFNEYRAVTTPTSSRESAKDFPHFPLVRYPQRGNSAISATPLPPPTKPSRHRAAETNLRRLVDPPHYFSIILFVTAQHMVVGSGGRVSPPRGATTRTQIREGSPGIVDELREMPMPSASNLSTPSGLVLTRRTSPIHRRATGGTALRRSPDLAALLADGDVLPEREPPNAPTASSPAVAAAERKSCEILSFFQACSGLCSAINAHSRRPWEGYER